MEKRTLKMYLLLISYAIGLILVVVHFEDILRGIGFFFKLLTPLFVGIVIEFVLNRPYEWFRSWYGRKMKLGPKTAKGIAILTVYLLAFGVVILIVSMVIPELARNLKMFAASADLYLAETQRSLNCITDMLGIQTIDISDLTVVVEEYFSPLINTMNQMLPQIIEVTVNFASKIANAFIAIALSIYIMSGKEKLLMQIRRSLRVYLPLRYQGGLERIYRTVSQVFGDFVAGQCKEAVILGILCFVGMMILRLDYAGLISVIIAVTALIPILGAYLGGIIGAVLQLFVSPGRAVLFLIFLIILQQVEGNIIYPRVVGRKIGLPGMWVLLGISVGGGLLGIWGMLLAVPFTTIIYQFLKRDVLEREQEMEMDE